MYINNGSKLKNNYKLSTITITNQNHQIENPEIF